VVGEQADAHEFLRCFLDNLDYSSLNFRLVGNAKSSIDERSIVKQVFGGCLRSQVLKIHLI
jgi:ubiquitin carboxyl-terminal hydrolase 36/42